MLDLDLSAAFDTVDLQSRQTFFCPTDVVSIRTPRSRRLETYQGLVSDNLANVSVSVSLLSVSVSGLNVSVSISVSGWKVSCTSLVITDYLSPYAQEDGMDVFLF
jgi:hypothetical protein